MIQAPNPAHMLFGPCRNIFSTRPPESRPLFKMATKLQVDFLWEAKFVIHILCMRKLHFVALNMLFSYICFTIFYYLTKTNLYNRTKYEKSDLFCTTWAHWYKSLSNISAWGSVSAFVQCAPKYVMAVPFNSIKSYLNWQYVPTPDSWAKEMGPCSAGWYADRTTDKCYLINDRTEHRYSNMMLN
jgi:hypothetical protein